MFLKALKTKMKKKEKKINRIETESIAIILHIAKWESTDYESRHFIFIQVEETTDDKPNTNLQQKSERHKNREIQTFLFCCIVLNPSRRHHSWIDVISTGTVAVDGLDLVWFAPSSVHHSRHFVRSWPTSESTNTLPVSPLNRLGWERICTLAVTLSTIVHMIWNRKERRDENSFIWNLIAHLNLIRSHWNWHSSGILHNVTKLKCFWYMLDGGTRALVSLVCTFRAMVFGWKSIYVLPQSQHIRKLACKKSAKNFSATELGKTASKYSKA